MMSNQEHNSIHVSKILTDVVARNPQITGLVENFKEEFIVSLSKFRILTHLSINHVTFMAQVRYLKSKYISIALSQRLGALVKIYKEISMTYFYDIFEKSEIYSTFLLTLKMFPKYLMENIPIFKQSPVLPFCDADKFVIIYRDLDKRSTTASAEEAYFYNVEKLNTYECKQLMWIYITRHSSVPTIKHSHYGGVREALSIIETFKCSSECRNKNFFHLDKFDAIAIHTAIRQSGNSESTNTTKIKKFRSLILFLIEQDIVTVDGYFFRYLQANRPQPINSPNPLEDEDVIKLEEYFHEKSTNSLFDHIIYVIFKMLIQTEFRISYICNMKIKDILNNLIPEHYIVSNITKVSREKKLVFAITDKTVTLLQNINLMTSDIKDQYDIKNIFGFIFIYKDDKGELTKMTSTKFTNELKKACKIVGTTKIYNSNSLRDTHMKHAVKFTSKNVSRSMVNRILTGHNSQETTNRHYVCADLEELIVSTYGVLVGKESFKFKTNIVTAIPQELESPEYDSSNNCGKCTAECCYLSTVSNCLVCKNFITSPEFLINFKRELENINRLMELTRLENDLEKMRTIKELVVNYIIHLEEISGVN